jgi:hypothetical protein
MSKNRGRGNVLAASENRGLRVLTNPAPLFMSNPFKTRPADRRFVHLHDQFAADPHQKADSMAGHRRFSCGPTRDLQWSTGVRQVGVGPGRSRLWPEYKLLEGGAGRNDFEKSLRVSNFIQTLVCKVFNVFSIGGFGSGTRGEPCQTH